MMRKDVKLGFAIGGVLLAVLVVYVLVGTGDSGQPTGAGIVTEDTSGGGKISPDKLTDANSSKVPDSSPSGTNSGVATPGTSGATTSNPPAGVASANDPNAKQNDANDLWGTALNEGQLLLTKTPDATPGGGQDASQIPARATPTGNAEDIKGTTSNTGTLATNGGGVANVPSNAPRFMRGNEVGRGVPTPTDASSNNATNTGTTGTTGANGTGGANGAAASTDNTSTISTSSEARPTAGAGQREHVVQRGETLSLIAQAAYGNANLYPAILRANPNLDPKRMRPGTTITLPPMSEVRPDASTGNASSSTQGGALSPSLASSSNEAAVDSKNEYRVQSNDSLYRISMKLYGRADMVDKLYALNRETIGSDPAKLKVNMLLKLPEPPTQAASR